VEPSIPLATIFIATRFASLRLGTGGGNEPAGSIKCGEFLDYLRTDYLLKKDSAPRSK